MKRSIIFLALSAILSIGTLFTEAPVLDVTIKDILDYPYEYMSSGNVRVKGTAWPGEQGEASGYYFLMDGSGSGSKIKVIKKIKAYPYPTMGQTYIVKGIVNISNDKQEISMQEFERESWSSNGTSIGVDIIILAILAIGLLGYIGYLLYQMASKKETSDDTFNANDKVPGGNQQPIINKPPEKIEGQIIHLTLPPNLTLKLLAGRFRTIKGDDIIKEIRFFHPRGEKSVEYIFGRDETTTHTKVKLRTPSVASKQASLLYSNENEEDMYTLINYAGQDATPTKVNGETMQVTSEQQLNEGDKIEMGLVVFAFTKED